MMETTSVGRNRRPRAGRPPMKREVSRKRWKEALELVKQDKKYLLTRMPVDKA
jgi:hypothetical protein